MNYKALQDDTLDRLSYDNTTASSTPRTRIGRYLNQWHRKLLSDPALSRLRDSQITFPTIAGQSQYGLPGSIAKIHRIWDAATNNPRLGIRSLDWLRSDPQSVLHQGTPLAYIPIGTRPTTRLPATTGVWVVSDNAADTATSKVVHMHAIRAGGYPHTASVQLAGTTRTQIGARTDYIDVLRVFQIAAAAGDVSLYDASASGNLLGVIPIAQTAYRYYVIALWPVPSSVITYTVECEVAIQDMTVDQDEPLLPEDFHDLLGAGARYQELLDVKKQFVQAGSILNLEIKPRMAALVNWVVNHPDYIVVPSDTRNNPSSLGSNLGSWYPKGYWTLFLPALSGLLPWLT